MNRESPPKSKLETTNSNREGLQTPSFKKHKWRLSVGDCKSEQKKRHTMVVALYIYAHNGTNQKNAAIILVEH